VSFNDSLLPTIISLTGNTIHCNPSVCLLICPCLIWTQEQKPLEVYKWSCPWHV